MSSGERNAGAWFLKPPPEDAERVLYCFPYPGCGQSSYRGWPEIVAGATVCAIQPPGRENRLREPVCPTHQDFARAFVDALACEPVRRFAFIGHCGAIPWVLESVFELHVRGEPLPDVLFSSSWGGPHRGMYGSYMTKSDAELAEVVSAMFGRTGRVAPPELAQIGVEVLRADLEVQRGYRWQPRRIPCPVVALRWTRDHEVTPQEVSGWERWASVAYETLDGDHFAYLDCPPPLQETIERCWTV